MDDKDRHALRVDLAHLAMRADALHYHVERIQQDAERIALQLAEPGVTLDHLRREVVFGSEVRRNP